MAEFAPVAKLEYSVIDDIFRKNALVNICAPMVRYSKQPFRTLGLTYDTIQLTNDK